MADETTPPAQPDIDPMGQKPYGQHHLDKAEKHRQQALTDAQLAADLLHNPRYDVLFAHLRPSAHEYFVSSYVRRRARWVEEGTGYEGYIAKVERQFEAEAYERLWNIQEKKLFDLQCQWRAELVEVPGVRFSGDFVTLSAHIENTTVVPPITPEELDIYLSWVQQADYATMLYEQRCHRFSWQDYDDIKMYLSEEDEEDEVRLIIDGPPHWYDFHNDRTGSGRFLRLPNLRGAKERRYQQANRDAFQAELAARHAHTPPPPYDPRPPILMGEDASELEDAFVRLFESKELARQRAAYEAANPEKSIEDEDLDDALFFLRDVSEPVPVPAHPDWRAGLRQAMFDFRKAKLLEMLPQVYAAYCQRREWGMAQPCYSDQPRHEVPESYVTSILDGRERLGEPRDFNF